MSERTESICLGKIGWRCAEGWSFHRATINAGWSNPPQSFTCPSRKTEYLWVVQYLMTCDEAAPAGQLTAVHSSRGSIFVGATSFTNQKIMQLPHRTVSHKVAIVPSGNPTRCKIMAVNELPIGNDQFPLPRYTRVTIPKQIYPRASNELIVAVLTNVDSLIV